MSAPIDCAAACEAAPICAACRRAKASIGRSVPFEMSAGYYNEEGFRYRHEPCCGHLWSGELARSLAL